jgi:sugar/nucleoside kinase (ribokinase family)
MFKYLVVSTAVTDEIILSNGTIQNPTLGGAGIYALAGIKVWDDEVAIITGIGKDFLALHGPWFNDNHLSTAGLTEVCEYTPRNTIQYFVDGERKETPVLGADHYKSIIPAAEDIAHYCVNAKGVYVFRDIDQDFWNQLFRLRNQHGFQLMWEIAADVATSENLEVVKSILKNVDLFSINKQEASHLFATNNVKNVIDNLRNLSLPLVFLRMGAEGAYIITRTSLQQIPSIHNFRVIDPTGGGNSSSGAVLVGYCENKDPLMSGIMGSISAAYAISQYGPPPILDFALRQQAETLAGETYENSLERHQ